MRVNNKVSNLSCLLLVSFCAFLCTYFRREHSRENNTEAIALSDGFKYLDRLISKCGQLCQIGGGEFQDSIYFEKRTVRVNCRAIFSDDVFVLHGHGKLSAPRDLPRKYIKDYSLNGYISISERYFDQQYLQKTASSPVWTKEQIESWTIAAKLKNLSGNYGSSETQHLRNALLNANGVKNGRVLVIGSENPWVEATVLSAGARSIVTLEYGKIISQHPAVQTMTPEEYKKQFRAKTLGLFDAIVTFSSVEHSGLGRYGDALNPWGDVLEIARAHCVCKTHGSLVIGVMMEKYVDKLVFNAHRVYGIGRWPYLVLLTGSKSIGNQVAVN